MIYEPKPLRRRILSPAEIACWFIFGLGLTAISCALAWVAAGIFT